MTGNEVIEEVNRLLLSGQREELNKLASPVSSGATSLTFTYTLGGILPGSLVTLDTETYRVWAVDDSTKTATVEPAMDGTTTAAHAAGTLAYVNPKLTRASIFKAINDELRALSAPSNGLFQMKSIEFSAEGVVTDYDIADDVVEIYEVRQSLPGPTMDWPSVPNWSYKPVSDTAMFPSGNALHIPGLYSGRDVQVLYKAAFDTLATPADDIAAVAGLPIEAQDILALGCLMRLGPVREIKRNFTEAQGDSRRAEEVPANAVQSSFTAVRQLRADRIQAEAVRLAVKYPVRHR